MRQVLMAFAVLVTLSPGAKARAAEPFFKPELYLPVENVPLQEARSGLARTRVDAWEAYFQRHGRDFNVYLDPRSGTPTGLQGRIPLIPGTGEGNTVTLEGLGRTLGREVDAVDPALVAEVVLRHLRENADALGIDTSQLGEARATRVEEHLWQVHIPQQAGGIPVRHARVAATLNHGNLVLLGTEAWGNVRAQVRASLSAAEALARGGEHLGLQQTPEALWLEPRLEWVPVTEGQGYGHRLAWVYGLQLEGEHERWKVSVDAAGGEVLEVEDDNRHATAKVVGGVYPVTNTNVCNTPTTCGTLQPGTPMPWADTGLPAPDNFTNGAGVFNASGATSTSLAGRYFRVTDGCGAIATSGDASGNIELGGVTGQTGCASGGSAPGNTPAARTAFYQLNKTAEIARGWLPSNAWLSTQVTTNVNLAGTCNASWNSAAQTLNFYRAGSGCNNTGEVPGVLDHEWGHGLDDNDANGVLSNSAETFADVAAALRSQSSCVGYGFYTGAAGACGLTNDGTGPNGSELSGNAAYCYLNCSGVRELDWDKNASHTPSTPQNFVCGQCASGTGPCGRQVHCASSPSRQAAWDLAARDLSAPPFSYSSSTAFLIASKLFFQGSGNIGTWHACNCVAGTSDGCGATNAYMQFLAADDDNGNLADGTPHMTAIHAAFSRHNIACATPAPVNSGCAAGPTSIPVLSASPGPGQASLSWNSVAGATQYWVLRSEGIAGCNTGKARIATVTGTSFIDTEVLDGRRYCYSVVAASGSACFSRTSSAFFVTPTGPCATPPSPALVSPANAASGVALAPVLDWADVAGAASYDVQVAPDPGFTTLVRAASSLVASTWTVPSPLLGNTTYYWRVRASNSCGPGPYSAAFSFRTLPACAVSQAAFNTALQAPFCGAAGCGCDTGTLVDSRGTLAGRAELNAPNTLQDSCADGNSGTYHSDESIDRVVVQTLDGAALAPGRAVQVDATVWCFNTSDLVDIYYATSASAPVWSAVATGLACDGSGARTFRQGFTLGGAAGQHAVRVQLRFGGAAGTCTAGSYNDRDDLAFQVAP